MSKIIKLTETQLVSIIKRVISEQTENGPVIPKNSILKVDEDVINHFRKFKVDFKKEETPEDFLGKLNKSNVGIFKFPNYLIFKLKWKHHLPNGFVLKN